MHSSNVCSAWSFSLAALSLDSFLSFTLDTSNLATSTLPPALKFAEPLAHGLFVCTLCQCRLIFSPGILPTSQGLALGCYENSSPREPASSLQSLCLVAPKTFVVAEMQWPYSCRMCPAARTHKPRDDSNHTERGGRSRTASRPQRRKWAMLAHHHPPAARR